MGIKFSLGGTEAETAEQNRAALWLSVFLIGSILLFCIYVQLSDRIKACLRRRREALFYAQWGAANSHLQPVVSDEPLLAGQVDVLRSQPAQQVPSASKLLPLSPDTTTCGDNVRLCAWTDVSLDTASVASSRDGSSSVNRGRCCCICLSSLSNCNQGVVETPCRHRFHYQCLREVVNRGPGGERAPCPLCRSIITWKGGDLMCTYDDPSL